MTTTIGDLVLELNLDVSKYHRALDEAHQQAIVIGKEIEASLNRTNGQLPTLTPKVDDSALTKLNQHLDLKVKHHTQVQNLFDAKPLTPKVDFKYLDQLDERLDGIHLKVKTLSTYLENNPLKVRADTSEIDTAEQRLADLQAQTKAYKSTAAYRQPAKQSTAAATPQTPANNASLKDKVQVVVQQQQEGFASKAADVVVGRLLERTLVPVVDLALEQGFVSVLNLTSSLLKKTLSDLPLGIGKVLGSEIDRLNKSIQNQYAPKGGVTGRVETAEKQVTKAVKDVAMMPAKIITAPVRGVLEGFYSGIGSAYGERIAGGAINRYEQQTGRKVEDIGRNAGGFTSGLTGIGAVNSLITKIGQIGRIQEAFSPVARKYGIDLDGGESLEEKGLGVAAAVSEKVGSILNKSLDEEKIQADLKKAQKAFLDLAQAIATSNDEAQKADALKDLAQSARSIISYPKEAVINRYKASAKESAQNLQERMESEATPIEPLDPDTKRVVFVSAGFSATGGKQSQAMAQALQPHIAEGAKVIPFENREFDVETDAAKNFPGWIKDALSQVSTTIEKGYNPSAVRMAAEAYQYKQQNPELGVDLIGHSAGGLIAREAQAILKEMGVEANVLSMGTPNIGAFSGMQHNAIGLMGQGDALRYAGDESSPVMGGVGGHELPHYASDPGVQQIVKQFTSGGVTPELLQEIEKLAQSSPKAADALRNFSTQVQEVEQTSEHAVHTAAHTAPPEPEQPDTSAVKESLMDLSRNDLKKITGAMGLKGASNLNKSNMSDRIIEMDAVVAKRMAAERKMINDFIDGEKQISAQLQQAAQLTGEAKTKALDEVRRATVEHIGTMDAVQNQIETPEFRSEYGALKGRAQHRLNTSLQFTSEQVENQRDRLEQGEQVEQAPEVESPFGDADVGLARISFNPSPQIAKAAQQAKQNVLKVIRLSQIWERQTTDNLEKNYTEFAKQVAQAGQVEFNASDLPRLTVDDKKLKQLGAKAFYDFKNNQIIVSKEIEQILNENPQKLEQYAEELKDLTHELRHATQLDFGKKSISKIATGEDSFNVDLIDESEASEPAKHLADYSLKAIQQQAYKKNRYTFTDQESATVKAAEVDAYSFEEQTPEILQKTSQALKGQSQSDFEYIKSVAKESIDSIVKNFAEANPQVAAVMGKIFSNVKDLPLKLAAGFLAFKGVQFIVDQLKQIIPVALDVAVHMEQVGRMFNFAYGSMSRGQAAMASVRSEAKALGINMQSALEGQAQLASATRGTNLEGAQTDRMGASMRKAIAVAGLDQQSSDRAYLAVEQMAQKGVISQEELRGQLSEALSGFSVPQVAAHSMGMDIPEFNKLVESGQLRSEQFLPRFFTQLSAESDLGIGDASKSSQAKINNFQNSMLEFQESLGKSLLPAQNAGLDVLAKSLDALQKVIGPLVQLLSSAALTAIIGLIAKIGAATIATKAWQAATWLFTSGWKQAIALLTSPAASFAGVTAGIFAGIEVLKVFGKAFSDAGQKARDFAVEGKKNLDNYRKSLLELEKTGQNLPTPKTSGAGDTGESLLGETLLGNFLGKDKVAWAERGVQQNLGKATDALHLPFQAFSPAAPLDLPRQLGQVANALHLPFQMSTYGQYAAEQQRSAENDFFNTGLDRQIEMQKLLAGYRSGTGEISNLQNIDAQLNEVQARRRALLPGDVNGRRSLEGQEQSLLQQREAAGKPISELMAGNAAYIEQLKDLKKEAEQRGDVTQVQRFNVELQKSVALQDQFNKLTQIPVGVLQRLSMSFVQINASLERTNMQLERTAAVGKRAIASAQIAGTTTAGQSDFAKTIIDTNQQQKQLEAQQKAIEQTRSALLNPDTLEALITSGYEGFDSKDPKKLMESLDQLNPAQMKERASQLQDGQQKDLLNQAADQVGQVQSLGTSNENLKTAIEEAKAQAVQKLRDLSTQIADFYRGLSQTAQELQIQAKQSELQAKTTQAQGMLKSALVGFQDSFINDFVDSLIQMIETLNKPMDAALQAQQQMLQAKQQYFQGMQQVFNYQQQMPTAQQVAGLMGGGQQAGNGQQPLSNGLPASSVPGAQAAGTVSNAPGQMSSGPSIGTSSLQTAIDSADGSGIMRGLQQQQSASPMQALQSGQQNLGASQSLLRQNYDTQVAMAQRQMQSQQYMAQIEAQVQASNAGYQLYKAHRAMQDQSRGFSRSAEDLMARGGQSGETDAVRSLNRDLEDSKRNMSDFQRGLHQTADQADFLYKTIKDGIAQGIMPPQMAQFLPRIQQMGRDARSQLNDLVRTAAEYQKAYDQALKHEEQERQYQAQQKAGGFDVQLYQAKAQQARSAGQDDVARDLDYRSRAGQQNLDFSAQIHDLNELKRTGQVTDAEFAKMQATLTDLNKVSLANLKKEIEDAYKEARYQAQQKVMNLDSQLSDARATEAANRGDTGGQAVEMAAKQGQEMIYSFREQVHELANLRKQGQLTNAEFDTMMGKVDELANKSFKNLSKQLEKDLQIKVAVSISADESEMSGADQQKAIQKMIGKFNLATEFSRTTGGDQNLMSSAVNQLQPIAAMTQGDRQDEALMAAAVNNKDNPFFSQILQKMGRGDIAQLADLATAGDRAEIAKSQEQHMQTAMGAFNDPLVNTFAKNQAALGDQANNAQGQNMANNPIAAPITTMSDRLAGKFDELIAATKAALNAPRSLTVNSPDPVNDASKIYADMAKDQARSC